MTPYDQIKRAKNRGNANQNRNTVTKAVQPNVNDVKSKQSSKLEIKRADKVSKPSYDNNQAYRSVRASASVVDMYQALQIVLGDKNRSDTMKKVLNVAMPKLLDTANKKEMFNKKLKGIKLIRTLK